MQAEARTTALGGGPIYLDHNATTPVRPEVVAAMVPVLQGVFGNPSSSHRFGVAAREVVEEARRQVAALLHASPDEIVFTSGGTEANNLALLGALAAAGDRPHVLTSAVEHPAVAAPLASSGAEVEVVGVDSAGRLDPDDLLRRIRPTTRLLTVMLANNETGTLQPVESLAGRGILLHTDAAQAVGKVEVDVQALGVDLLTVAGHKMGAPKGVGALYVRRGTPLRPVLRGAGHERGLRPGTENVASIAGLGEACRLAQIEGPARQERLRALRDRLHARLSPARPTLNGHPALRLPNTLNVSFPGVTGAQLLARVPELAASTGSACHDRTPTPSAVLTAMGLPAERALGAVRLSVGHETTDDEVDRAAASLVCAWQALTRGA